MDKQLLCKDSSIEEVIREYSNMVYRLAFARTRNKCNSDDIYQEVFLIYIKNNPRFETEEHRKAWLIRVTINCCKNMWASSWTRKVVLSNEVVLAEDINLEIEEESELHNSLEKLSPKYRTIIHLFYYEDMSVKEISKTLDRKESTIRTQLTRARGKLKEILKEDFDV